MNLTKSVAVVISEGCKKILCWCFWDSSANYLGCT